MILITSFSITVSAKSEVIRQNYDDELVAGNYVWAIGYLRNGFPVTEITEDDPFGVLDGSTAKIELLSDLGGRSVEEVNITLPFNFYIDDELRDPIANFTELFGGEFMLSIFHTLILPTEVEFDDGSTKDLFVHSEETGFPVYQIGVFALTGVIEGQDYVIKLSLSSLELEARWQITTGLIEYWFFSYEGDETIWTLQSVASDETKTSSSSQSSAFSNTNDQTSSTSDPDIVNTDESDVYFSWMALIGSLILVARVKLPRRKENRFRGVN